MRSTKCRLIWYCWTCVVILSLTCQVLVCYYWPWKVSPEKAAFIELDWKFIHKKSIPLIRPTHLWFTHICVYPNHPMKSMKLITRSCCLSLTQPYGCTPRQTTRTFPLQTIIMNSAKYLQPSVHLSHQAKQLCTFYIQYSCSVWQWGFMVWSSKNKNLANHWLSLVLMKENNSLTWTKTVQKQPFLMSDISCPQDAFYVSDSLIKQHPREWDRGHVTCACVCVCVRICAHNFWCLNCQVRIGHSDLHTTRFNHTSCRAIYPFFFSLTIYLVSFWAKRWA